MRKDIEPWRSPGHAATIQSRLTQLGQDAMEARVAGPWASYPHFSCFFWPSPGNSTCAEEGLVLTRRFQRTSFRRFVYRQRRKQHTISPPSRVAIALGEVNPNAWPEVVFNFSVGRVVGGGWKVFVTTQPDV